MLKNKQKNPPYAVDIRLKFCLKIYTYLYVLKEFSIVLVILEIQKILKNVLLLNIFYYMNYLKNEFLIPHKLRFIKYKTKLFCDHAWPVSISKIFFCKSFPKVHDLEK